MVAFIKIVCIRFYICFLFVYWLKVEMLYCHDMIVTVQPGKSIWA